jgi:hypothetical protein
MKQKKKLLADSPKKPAKNTHGGARRGAGRKTLEPNKRPKMLSVRASVETLAKLRADCERLNLSQADYLRRLIEKGLEE